jgi:hypothetical protein
MDLRTLPRALLLLAAARCASAPPPTPGALRIARNPRAVVEGRVRDTGGRPVAGMGVEALPHSVDVPRVAKAVTDSEGRFRLTLFAPAEYGFLLSSGGISVVTSDPRDPSRVTVAVEPGENKSGIELSFLEEEWRRIEPGPPLHAGGGSV